MPPSTHAKLSPSAAFRCLNCTPSLKMSEAFPNSTSVYAEEGTTAHELAEKKLRLALYEYADAEAAAALEWEVDRIRKTSEYFDADMDDYTDGYVNEIIAILKDSPFSDVLIEEVVNLDDVIAGGYGTADCVILRPGKAVIVDFKYGKHVPVSADHNYQLQLYAIGALEMYDAIYSVTDVELRIIQPRAGGSNNWTTTKTELFEWRDKFVKPRADQALKGAGECAIGEWCTFCEAKPICRKYASQYDVPELYLGSPSTLSPYEVGERLNRLDGVVNYLDKLKSYALRESLNGNKIPGYKVVEGRGSRVWTDMTAAFREANNAGFEDSLLYERVPLTLTGVEKVMGKRLFNDALGIYVTKTKGKPTLAPESDKRKEYAVESAADDFKDIKV